MNKIVKTLIASFVGLSVIVAPQTTNAAAEKEPPEMNHVQYWLDYYNAEDGKKYESLIGDPKTFKISDYQTAEEIALREYVAIILKAGSINSNEGSAHEPILSPDVDRAYNFSNWKDLSHVILIWNVKPTTPPPSTTTPSTTTPSTTTPSTTTPSTTTPSTTTPSTTTPSTTTPSTTTPSTTTPSTTTPSTTTPSTTSPSTTTPSTTTPSTTSPSTTTPSTTTPSTTTPSTTTPSTTTPSTTTPGTTTPSTTSPSTTTPSTTTPSTTSPSTTTPSTTSTNTKPISTKPGDDEGEPITKLPDTGVLNNIVLPRIGASLISLGVLVLLRRKKK